MFSTEQEMSKLFERYLKANFGNTYLKEYQGLFGIPDFIFYAKEENDISIISFELKLKNWKRAAKQAFRYKSFSNISYVVLSATNIKAALGNIDWFERYNIGLAKFDTDNYFEILHKPILSVPYSEQLTSRLKENISSCKRKFKNIDILISKVA
jgi:hypothetical protein